MFKTATILVLAFLAIAAALPSPGGGYYSGHDYGHNGGFGNYGYDNYGHHGYGDYNGHHGYGDYNGHHGYSGFTGNYGGYDKFSGYHY